MFDVSAYRDAGCPAARFRLVKTVRDDYEIVDFSLGLNPSEKIIKPGGVISTGNITASVVIILFYRMVFIGRYSAKE